VPTSRTVRRVRPIALLEESVPPMTPPESGLSRRIASIAHLDGPWAELAARYQEVRERTEALCAPLETEDYVVQSMPDASPAKWHLAHTSWFFETFVLKGVDAAVDAEGYAYLFNSYYNAIGERTPRAERGLLSRPTVAEVYRYRRAVDDRMAALLEPGAASLPPSLAELVVLGLNHEQQHQELILTDLKSLFARNPLRPVYRSRPLEAGAMPAPVRWVAFERGLHQVGHAGAGFAYDNELPRHKVYLEPFLLADRLTTCGEFLAFIDDGGYERPEFWLSDGWSVKTAQGWRAPLYWERERAEGAWRMMTLAGPCPVDPAEPVCHVSFYEADAFARWSSARLPTEGEWEIAAESAPVRGNLLESERFHPAPLSGRPLEDAPTQLFGDVWEWTQSPYVAYPGYRPAAGALGEYNGKFMCNQLVLRGGSCATPGSHIRATYRNFFPPEARWQFSGIRLARDVERT
jgi:ergothioneine biosynthesis protein EgtB